MRQLITISHTDTFVFHGPVKSNVEFLSVGAILLRSVYRARLHYHLM